MTNAPDFIPASTTSSSTTDRSSWRRLRRSTTSSTRPTGWADEPDPEDEPTVGAMELAERHQLRRVAGLRTELEDITEVEYRQLRLERVVLVGVWTEGTVEDAENSMAELALLAETAGSEVLEAIYQRRQTPDPATYVGRGKVEGIAEIVQATGADTVICDGELAPSQLRNLEDRLKVKVVDRTALILDIFAQHARSGEAPGPDRAGPAQLHEAAPARLGWQPLPPGRWPGRRRCRHRWPWPR